MIRSFKSKEAEKVFNRTFSRRLPSDIQQVAYRKLRMLHNAESLNDVRATPGNHLEALQGDRAGQWSIRVNDQWRVCFTWDGHDAYDVLIEDYH